MDAPPPRNPCTERERAISGVSLSRRRSDTGRLDLVPDPGAGRVSEAAAGAAVRAGTGARRQIVGLAAVEE